MFCKYCGTNVPDGYICGCPESQRAAQAAAAATPQYAGQYDPNAQYQGQYDPNAQYQGQYDPNAQYQGQYAGQYNPNAQYQGQYDPNAQYQGQYDPNAQYQGQYAGQYNPNAQYQGQYMQYRQQPAGPGFGQKLSEAFRAMPATFRTLKADLFGAGVNAFTGGIFAVGSFALNLLAWLFIFMGIFGEAMDYMDGIYGTAILTGFLAWLIPTALVMLIPLLGQLARKESVDFGKCFVQASCANLLPTAMIFLSSLFMLMSVKMGLILLAVTMVQGVVITAKLTNKQLKNANGLFGALLEGVIVAAVALLVAWIVSAPFADYLSMMLSRGFM